MYSRFHAKKGCYFCLLTVLIGWGSNARAELILTSDNIVFGGRVSEISNGSIHILAGCQGNTINTIPLSSVSLIDFTPECSVSEMRQPAGGFQICDVPRQDVYQIRLKTQSEPIYASNIEIAESNRTRIDLAGEHGSLFGVRSSISSILRTRICPTIFAEVPQPPDEYCFESRQWAINWNPEPAYNNKIFTKGVSIFVETSGAIDAAGNKATELRSNIREAFGSAFTIWMAALQDNQEILDSHLREFLASSLSCSENGYCLLTPPQVIERKCAKSNPHFIVRIHHSRDQWFPEHERHFVAKAQVEGRTIILNAIDYEFNNDLAMQTISGEGKINLITVLAHELGHSIGLAHTDGQAPSIMNPDSLSRYPSSEDAKNLAEVLQRSIRGSQAGVLDAKNCLGLKVAE